eukprot:TRINITY_DN1062_c0_g1_i1.p1 TRINITY_DN1062_c0_g1~~TRINITY_DN1062_c0_g1_i1.p1  ORF type:complete len:552 (-),score=176.32 TRINITY_DN1062_c0_g1_i1:75-1670(-)
MNVPVLVMNTNTQRETGRKAQLSNISAAGAVADIVRTTLGPRAMLKMILDPTGGIVLTNDGNAILREVDVSHPAAKSVIELSRTQDEEVGDGTTSVIILAAEMLSVAQLFIERNVHPTIIVSAYRKALDEACKALDSVAVPVDVNDYDQLLKVAISTTGTKFISRYGPAFCGLAVKAVQKVIVDRDDGKKDVDIKQYIRIEKIPGGEITDSEVLEGIMLNKDVTHPQMSRRIENPRIVLLDCPLEYKKGESQTNIELSSGEDWSSLLKMEEEYIERICQDIIAVRPDLVITEKGVSDLAQHFLMKAGISAIRRVRKTDNNRIGRAVGAKICNRTESLTEEDVGTECGLFEIQKIGDEYFTYLVKCKNPKACTVVLRGGSKDVLNEIERNLDDAMGVCRTLVNDPRVVPGGGACEMAVSRILTERSRFIEGVEQWPFKAVATALEVIPKTLMDNCGAQTIRVLTELRAKHAENGNSFWGVDGNSGEIKDIRTIGIVEPLAVKAQTFKTAIESATLLLRVDEIVSGIGKRDKR